MSRSTFPSIPYDNEFIILFSSKEGWLEPLLSRITENRRIAAIPLIDNIEEQSFEYKPVSGKQWGGFSWKLNFLW